MQEQLFGSLAESDSAYFPHSNFSVLVNWLGSPAIRRDAAHIISKCQDTCYCFNCLSLRRTVRIVVVAMSLANVPTIKCPGEVATKTCGGRIGCLNVSRTGKKFFVSKCYGLAESLRHVNQ